MEQTLNKREPECVKMQIDLCGEVLRKIREQQEKHYADTGQRMSKRHAIYKLILGK